MDPLTRQHTATYHGKSHDHAKLKQECFQFIIKDNQNDPKIREDFADFLLEIGLYEKAIKNYY